MLVRAWLRLTLAARGRPEGSGLPAPASTTGGVRLLRRTRRSPLLLAGAVATGANGESPVEHAVSFDPVRPWRTAALVAGGVAAIELVVLVAGGLAIAGKPLWRDLGGAAAATTHRAVVPKHLAPAPLPAPIPHLARART